jgi:hypothetical protein
MMTEKIRTRFVSNIIMARLMRKICRGSRLARVEPEFNVTTCFLQERREDDRWEYTGRKGATQWVRVRVSGFGVICPVLK